MNATTMEERRAWSERDALRVLTDALGEDFHIVVMPDGALHLHRPYRLGADVDQYGQVTLEVRVVAP